MAAPQYKTATQLKALIVGMIPVPIYNDETGATMYPGEVIPTQIEPNNVQLQDQYGITNPAAHKANDAVSFVKETLTPFEADLDYVLKGNKTSSDYVYLKKMITNYGERP